MSVKPIDFQGMQPKANEISRNTAHPQVNDQQMQKKEQIEESKKKKQKIEKSNKSEKIKAVDRESDTYSKNGKKKNQEENESHFDARA